MQLNGNEFATVNSWRVRCQWQTTQNEMYWKGTGTGGVMHIFSLLSLSIVSTLNLAVPLMQMSLSENRFLFIQWKLIASINDCCVCGLSDAAPELMWLNWEYGRTKVHTVHTTPTVHCSFRTLTMMNAISLAWTAFGDPYTTCLTMLNKIIRISECVLIESLRSIDLFSFLMI